MGFQLKKLRADWKRLTDMKKEEVAGLDVGSSCVKLVQLRSGVGGYVASAACKAETGIVEQDDERTRASKTIAAIKQCFEQSKMQSRQMVCGVCGPEVAVRPFSFPSLPPTELLQAVMLEAEQVCPFDPAKNILEYQLVSGDSTSLNTADMKGVLVAATHEVVRSKTQLVSNASLNCALMDIDGLALVNCFTRTEPRTSEQTTALLNVGHTFTNLVIVSEKKLPFIRDIAHGGSDIIEHIAAERNLVREDVARAVISGDDPKIIESLAGGAGRLISEINESLRFYMSEHRIGSIDKVFVCGGFSLVKGFVELLNKQVLFGAKLWDPFDRIGRPVINGGGDGLKILETYGPAMAVAAGLAMRSI
jgi:type IV pilus assembly protein PilM